MSVSSSISGESESSESSDSYPADFPLDPDIYDQTAFSAPSTPAPAPNPPSADPNDPRRRDFDSLYPLAWLAGTPPPAGTAYAAAPIGRLRTQWAQAFQQANNGSWQFVEYAPAWSDPDWSSRYQYTVDPSADVDDAVVRQYVKSGMLQNQRPALRPEDAELRPTEAARRWGVYP